ncbi:10548_t:CDS:1 [Dentiscutata erythropus]|uniref:10548_t:CDS:1 n=1 Tax=Dentiscutata erythropus TaxID=1348616 RepID=A0A9N9FR62_9GLOM|nr:10548_t:CDS:1 [Dentiscutata erythropus]
MNLISNQNVPSYAPLCVVISKSTINNLTIEFVRQNGFYFVRHLNNYSLFSVPSSQNAWIFNKAPPSCFILFRLNIQGCLVTMNIRLERKMLSKHASNLWKGVKINDRHLENAFKSFYDAALYKFNCEQLNIRMVVPPATPQQPAAQEQSSLATNDFDNSFDGMLKDLFNF